MEAAPFDGPLRSGFWSYKDKANGWVKAGDEDWSLKGFENASQRGPTVTPLNNYLVILQDEYADRTKSGLVLFAPNAMEEALQAATVLHGGNGTYTKKGKHVPPKFKTGDRVVCYRFIAYNRMLDVYNERVRIPNTEEIYGFLDEEEKDCGEEG